MCIPRAAHMAQLALLRHAPTNDLLSTTCHTHVPCIHFAHRCAGCMRPYHLALDMRHRRTLDSSHPTDARPSLPLLLPVTCVNNNTTTYQREPAHPGARKGRKGRAPNRGAWHQTAATQHGGGAGVYLRASQQRQIGPQMFARPGRSRPFTARAMARTCAEIIHKQV